jgi:tRNA nucleotidyltransferase/poly(A) polymerase
VKLYLVGGAVRRHLLGLPATSDFDFAVEAESYEAMRDELVSRYNVRVWQERPAFVCVRGQVSLDMLGEFGGLLSTTPGFTRINSRVFVDADFTLCRAETQYSDRRHPDSVTPCSVLEDLSRRDFTVNAVAVREDGQWVDPHNGRADAADHTLRCVGNTRQRMLEDPLRLMRAVRFGVTERLHHDLNLKRALTDPELVDLLPTLPVERVREELGKALASNWRKTMLYLMVDAPILAYTLHHNYPNLWLKATTESR